MNHPHQGSHHCTRTSNERATTAIPPPTMMMDHEAPEQVIVLQAPLHPAERRRSSNISFERHSLEIAADLMAELEDYESDTDDSTVETEEDLVVGEEDFGTTVVFRIGEEEERQVLLPEDDFPEESTSTDLIPNSAVPFFFGTAHQGSPHQDDTLSGRSRHERPRRASSMIAKVEDDILAKAFACGKILNDEEGSQLSPSSSTAGSSFRRISFARTSDKDDASGGDEDSCAPATTDGKAATRSTVQDGILAALQELREVDCNNQKDGKAALSSDDGKPSVVKKPNNDDLSNNKGSSLREGGAVAMSVKMVQVSAPPPQGARPRRSSFRRPPVVNP